MYWSERQYEKLVVAHPSDFLWLFHWAVILNFCLFWRSLCCFCSRFYYLSVPRYFVTGSQKTRKIFHVFFFRIISWISSLTFNDVASGSVSVVPIRLHNSVTVGYRSSVLQAKMSEKTVNLKPFWKNSKISFQLYEFLSVFEFQAGAVDDMRNYSTVL